MSRLDTLPPEILFNILSYTEPPHCLRLSSSLSSAASSITYYPLNALAATNKQLHAIVEEHARNLLKRHVDIVPPRNARVFSCRRKWLGELCYYCKKKSKRRACLYREVTCCLACDRKEFDKMTMTQAIHQTHLSKLDLFTPSPLHPHLPPLATGAYPVMAATMISTPDVLARSAYIRAQLGEKGQDDKFMRRRCAAHDRLVKHMNIEYCEGRGWVAGGPLVKLGPKSMQSEEARKRYVEEGLRKEWEALELEPFEDVIAGVWRGDVEKIDCSVLARDEGGC